MDSKNMEKVSETLYKTDGKMTTNKQIEDSFWTNIYKLSLLEKRKYVPLIIHKYIILKVKNKMEELMKIALKNQQKFQDVCYYVCFIIFNILVFETNDQNEGQNYNRIQRYGERSRK